METRLMNQFESLGTERLKPVFDSLDSKIDYETLAVYRVYYLSEGYRENAEAAVINDNSGLN